MWLGLEAMTMAFSLDMVLGFLFITLFVSGVELLLGGWTGIIPGSDILFIEGYIDFFHIEWAFEIGNDTMAITEQRIAHSSKHCSIDSMFSYLVVFELLDGVMAADTEDTILFSITPISSYSK